MKKVNVVKVDCDKGSLIMKNFVHKNHVKEHYAYENDVFENHVKENTIKTEKMEMLESKIEIEKDPLVIHSQGLTGTTFQKICNFNILTNLFLQFA